MNEFVNILAGISERQRVEMGLRKLSLAVEQSPASIVITDSEGRIEYVNPTCSVVSGYSAEDMLGENPRLFQSGRTPFHVYHELWSSVTQGKQWYGRLTNRHKDGSEYVEQAIISPVRHADGQVRHYLAVKETVGTPVGSTASQCTAKAALHLAHDLAELAIYDVDMTNGAVYWDERMRKQWGLVAGEPAGDKSMVSPATAAVERSRSADNFADSMRLEELAQVRREQVRSLLGQPVATQTAVAIAHQLNQPLIAIAAFGEAALAALGSSNVNADRLRQAFEACVEQAQRAEHSLNELLTHLASGVETTLETGVAAAAALRLARLTTREHEVMSLAIKGLHNKEIARHLAISHRTVEFHKAKIMRKTGAANLLELAHLADAVRHLA